jgi:hypothetical protein
MGWAARLVAYFSAIGEACTGLNKLTHIGGRWVPRSPKLQQTHGLCVDAEIGDTYSIRPPTERRDDSRANVHSLDDGVAGDGGAF